MISLDAKVGKYKIDGRNKFMLYWSTSKLSEYSKNIAGECPGDSLSEVVGEIMKLQKMHGVAEVDFIPSPIRESIPVVYPAGIRDIGILRALFELRFGRNTQCHLTQERPYFVDEHPDRRAS